MQEFGVREFGLSDLGFVCYAEVRECTNDTFKVPTWALCDHSVHTDSDKVAVSDKVTGAKTVTLCAAAGAH
jgi:hypothetical protein